MEENWEDLKDFEGYYQISKSEEVKTTERFFIKSNGRIQRIKERILKKTIRSDGYITYVLCKDGVKYQRKLHDLMAEQWIPNPENLPQLNHKSGIKTACSITNLEWCTQKFNNKHARDTGLNKQFGENASGAKLTEEQVLKIKELRGIISGKKLAEIYNVSMNYIYTIHEGRKWKHLCN